MLQQKIDPTSPEHGPIDKAVEILRDGGIVVYPTDTAYGLGVDATNESALAKLYRLKGRDFTKPTHVIVKNWQMLKELCYPNSSAFKIYKAFMPGPITLVLPKRKHVSDTLTAGLNTLGVRIPNNVVTRKISILFGKPFTTPSANRSKAKTPYSLAEVRNVLDINQVDLLLDAGKLPNTLPSTLVDLTGEKPVILREGPITQKQIMEVLAA